MGGEVTLKHRIQLTPQPLCCSGKVVWPDEEKLESDLAGGLQEQSEWSNWHFRPFQVFDLLSVRRPTAAQQPIRKNKWEAR